MRGPVNSCYTQILFWVVIQLQPLIVCAKRLKKDSRSFRLSIRIRSRAKLWVVAQFVGASLRGRPLFPCDVRRPGAHGGTPLQIRPLRNSVPPYRRLSSLRTFSRWVALPQKYRDCDISFTPGFSPVANDEKRRDTVFNGFLICCRLIPLKALCEQKVVLSGLLKQSSAQDRLDRRRCI